ncbi:hypothetical protein K450DRAFT_247895 [Umbelopsis ramanniana AG]|uniref:Uncharacterized protein n=1 Tax=Umbelopsis ramanniana AG TaxID=1314678 RepID=A0AAD5HDK4_UMBRA|nr:uncharacterized protein K450DRAFT_247895 [Umbelopsis ramanniana AG]KAI8578238.1 hypothetical protein K450DRAFT_247895 [Umbelopsis ramanniana AG]
MHLKLNNLFRIEINLPTPKTANIKQYEKYLRYVLLHLETILSFYHYDRGIARFHNYIGRQRAREEMVNVFANGGKKYNAENRKNTRKNRRRRKKNRKGNTKHALPTGPRESTARRTLGTMQGPQHWKPLTLQIPFEPRPVAPIIAFGDAMFGIKNHSHLKGKPVGLVNVLMEDVEPRKEIGKACCRPD